MVWETPQVFNMSEKVQGPEIPQRILSQGDTSSRESYELRFNYNRPIMIEKKGDLTGSPVHVSKLSNSK